jgi:hypothetical protein
VLGQPVGSPAVRYRIGLVCDCDGLSLRDFAAHHNPGAKDQVYYLMRTAERMGESHMARRPQDTVQLKVRLPQGLHHLVESAAAEGGRSLNAEIVSRLFASFQKDVDRTEAVARLLLAVLPPAILGMMARIPIEERRTGDKEAEDEAREWERWLHEMDEAGGIPRWLTMTRRGGGAKK